MTSKNIVVVFNVFIVKKKLGTMTVALGSCISLAGESKRYLSKTFCIKILI